MKPKIAKAKGKVIKQIRPIYVSPDYIDHAWPLVQEHIERGLKPSNGRINAEDVRQFLKDDLMQLFLIMRGDACIGSIVTEFVNYPRKRICRVVSLGGKYLREWVDLKEQLGEWARTEGCAGIEAWSRRGMTRYLPSWRTGVVLLETDL